MVYDNEFSARCSDVDSENRLVLAYALPDWSLQDKDGTSFISNYLTRVSDYSRSSKGHEWIYSRAFTSSH